MKKINIIKKVGIGINIFLALTTIVMVMLHIYVVKGNLLHDIASYITCGMAILNFGLTFVFFNKKERWFSGIISTGVVFATLGDLLIGKSIILGGSLFAAGHVFYMISFFIIKFNAKEFWKDLICVLFSIGIGLTIIFVPKLGHVDLLPFLIVYVCVLSAMLGKAISNVIFNKNNKALNIFMFVGALFFFVSDMMLFTYWFKSSNIFFDRACLITYFIAQVVFSTAPLFALLFIKEKNQINNKTDNQNV